MLARLASLVILAAVALMLAWPALAGGATWRTGFHCYWTGSASIEVGYGRASIACFWNP